jgi:hypothetical protein
VTLQQPDLISGHLPSCDGPNIRCFDPSLTAVWTAYPAEPLLSFFYSPVERASRDHVADSTSTGGSTARRLPSEH